MYMCLGFESKMQYQNFYENVNVCTLNLFGEHELLCVVTLAIFLLYDDLSMSGELVINAVAR